MMLGNSSNGYGCVSRVVHWLAVALVATAFGLAWTMTEMASGPDKFRLYGLHKSIGALILGLGLARIVWTAVQPAPVPLGELPPWQRAAAKAVHGLLLLWLVAMPLSGWLMSSAAGRPVSVFGWFVLPNLLATDKDLAHAIKEMHEMLASLGMFLIATHVAAALWHHFVLKDGTLRRMLPCVLGGCGCTDGVCAGPSEGHSCGCGGKGHGEGKGDGPGSCGCGGKGKGG
jgi:cytochrome b561